jgi:hypothetical protein
MMVPHSLVLTPTTMTTTRPRLSQMSFRTGWATTALETSSWSSGGALRPLRG